MTSDTGEWFLRGHAAASILFNDPVWAEQTWQMDRGERIRGDYAPPLCSSSSTATTSPTCKAGGVRPTTISSASCPSPTTTSPRQSISSSTRCVLHRDPGAPLTDIHNPAPRLRSHPADSLVVLSRFVADGARWRDSVYDPRSGRIYRSFLAVHDGRTLDVTGCLLMFCRSQRWRREDR